MTAISGTVSSFKSMADGCIRIAIDFSEAESKQAMRLLCDVGAAVAIARLADPDDRDQDDGPDTVEAPVAKAPYGQEAKALRLSGFFLRPEVWKAVGTDAEFLAWLRTQPCCICKAPAPSEAAHVRRIANGAGTGLKPPYSACSMCHAHHAKQHSKGESAVGGKAFLDEMRVKALQAWCWTALRFYLGRNHWSEVPPADLRDWATIHKVYDYLPACYKEP